MKRFRILSACVLIFVLALAFPATAQDTDEVFPEVPAPAADVYGTDETSLLWFVQFAGRPIADGGDPAAIQNEHANFRANAAAAGLHYSQRFEFSTLWNGVSVELGGLNDINTLGKLRGVQALYPVVTVPIPETTSVDPDLVSALSQTGADVAQSELGLSGAGVRVAVMDTGVDLDHPDLGGDGVPSVNPDFNGRVVTGYDFVGDAYNADSSSTTYNPVPSPDSSPDDCNGHGTHVAGIIGASGDPAAGGALGVAPGVTFGAYRVFGCAGSTTADIMIAAMERALADDMDVLNMSIGSAFQWPNYPTAEASNRLVNEGMVVVASIGNSGANGVFSAGAPGLGDKVIGVASFDNTHILLPYFTITPDDTPIGYNQATAAPAAPLSGTYPMSRTGTVASLDDACSPLPAGSLTGTVALIRRGTCTFYLKSSNAQEAGAVAVVLYNNNPPNVGRFNPTVAPPTGAEPPITIPVVSISDAEGALIDSRLAAGPVDMTWTDQVSRFSNTTANRISSFSSYGLSPDLALKPDIGAPGGFILSTYPLERGGYAVISGTSMSSPHVAGAVALLLEAHPNMSAQSVDEILQNSADPKNWQGNPGLGFLDQVHRQGAGMLDIVGAVEATAHISPSELPLGESEAGPQTRTLTVNNHSGADLTFTLGHAPALATGGNTFAPGAFISFASISYTSAGAPVSSVFVPAGGSAAVDVTITAPAVVNRQYGGYLVFSSSDSRVYRVPYAGFAGNYQSIVALPTRLVPAAPATNSNVALPAGGTLPTLAELDSCGRFVDLDCTRLPVYTAVGGGTFDLTDGFNRPYFLLHFDHQVRQIRATVYSTDDKNWHMLGNFNYVGRNSTFTGFFSFPFDGTTFNGGKTVVVPDGQYYVVFEVLKALGDTSNPADWETWTSPVITIDRP